MRRAYAFNKHTGRLYESATRKFRSLKKKPSRILQTPLLLYTKRDRQRVNFKTKVRISIFNSATLLPLLQLLEYTWCQGPSGGKEPASEITYDEIQVTRHQTCSIQAIRTV